MCVVNINLHDYTHMRHRVHNARKDLHSRVAACVARTYCGVAHRRGLGWVVFAATKG